MEKMSQPPSKVTVFYRPIGGSHTFTSSDLEGLYVARTNLREAYSVLIDLVGGLLERRTGTKGTKYHFPKGYEAFEKMIVNRNPLLPTSLELKRIKRVSPKKPPRQKAAA
jgi:hypothetical protein